MMRVHLPAAWVDLETLAAGGLMSPRLGFPVADPDDDDASEAARFEAEALAVPGARVVISADLPADQLDARGSAVELRCGVPLGWVAAVFVEDEPPGDDLLWFAPSEVVHLVATRRANLGA